MLSDDAILEYIRRLFAAEDDVLAAVRQRHSTEGLPAIHISSDEGKLIAVLLRAVGARRVLEVGTLGGYSGIWIARALPDDGLLTTIERDPKHAGVARESFADAGVVDRVELMEGDALEVLAQLEPGFDAVFLDADKEPLEAYYHEAMRLLRVGGLLLCDNALLNDRVIDDRDDAEDVRGIRACNSLAAKDPRLTATIIPVRDGLLAGIKESG